MAIDYDELEKRVIAACTEHYQNADKQPLFETIYQLSVKATIDVLRELETMKKSE